MIRTALPADIPDIARLIRALAEYEKLTDALALDESRLHEHLFGKEPRAEVLIAEVEGRVAGFALFFHNYSTFKARPGLYLEDLFVEPAMRGRGLGKALFQALAKLAHDRGCCRMEWAVLRWNEPALDFYRRFDAEPLEEWITYRLTGPALERAGQR